MNELSQQLTDLANELNTLAASYKDQDGKRLLDLQDQLIDSANAASLKQLQVSDENYKDALAQIQKAMDIIAKGSKKIDTITKVIGIAGKVLESTAKAIATVL